MSKKFSYIKLDKTFWAYSRKTICPRSAELFYIVGSNIKWVATSWTYTVCPRSAGPFYIVAYYIIWVPYFLDIQYSIVQFPFVLMRMNHETLHAWCHAYTKTHSREVIIKIRTSHKKAFLNLPSETLWAHLILTDHRCIKQVQLFDKYCLLYYT